VRYDFKRQRILKKTFVAEKVVRPWPDRRLRSCEDGAIFIVAARATASRHDGRKAAASRVAKFAV